jgi:hypothetical protein
MCIMSHHQNTGQNHSVVIANRSLENMTKFRYLGMTVTNQNHIHKEIKNRLKAGNAYCSSVLNLVFSSAV